MKLGDIVRLDGCPNCYIGIVIEIISKESAPTDYEEWDRVIILYPNGHITWEYDIDLEVINV